MAQQYHKYNVFLCIIVLLALTSVRGSNAARNYAVSNNAQSSVGSKQFDREVGSDYVKQTVSSATDFIHQLFQQNNPSERKNVENVQVIVENIDGIAFGSDGEIHVSAEYIGRYSGDVKKDITGVLYHEMTHLLQWDAQGMAPSGLVEGIADYVRLKAGYAADDWVPPGRGDDWFQGYDVTARFLEYCNSISNGFVADLNSKMKASYSDSYFTELLGKPVAQLWSDYKAKYSPS